jgi:hypothetical protein
VYPALLSRVAWALHVRIILSGIVKDGLAHKNAFDGRQAVDNIAYLIKTTNHNLVLLLGRALDKQNSPHAVTYDHRLLAERQRRTLSFLAGPRVAHRRAEEQSRPVQGPSAGT